ncbi:MAG: 4Fe-4S binding protein [Clostridia bacterium]|nr:4Fe-4S binding protein [Clostridia bacterium]
MNQEAIIICETIYHGNTMKLAKAMAFTINCEIVSAQQALTMDLSKFKVVGLGSGIYFTSHHPRIMEIGRQLNAEQKTFIFSTHGAPFLGRYHVPLMEVLKKRNVEIIGEFSSKGFDCTGPFIIINGGNKGKPNENDERKAMRFITKILPQYAKDLSDVPKGHFVNVNEACVACGLCTTVCPMNVFSVKEHVVQAQNDQNCIHCSLCQKACPSQAISIKHSFFEAIKIAQKHAGKKNL